MGQGQVHKLFDAQTGTAVSRAVNTVRYGSKRGLFHLYWVNQPTGTFLVDLEVSPDGAFWSTLLAIDQSVPLATNGSYSTPVIHYPYVRANIISNTTAQLSVWYIE